MISLGKRSISTKISIVLVILLLLTLTSPLFISEAEAGLADSSWPKFRGNLKNTGRNEDAIREVSNNTRWAFETDGRVDASPAVGSDGTIYIGDLDGNLTAVEANGSERWKFETSSSISCTPALSDDGTIYFVTNGGNFYSLNEDGEKNWVRDDILKPERTGASVFSSPVVREDGTVLVASEKLFSVYPNGTVQWSFTHRFEGEDDPSPGIIQSSPAIDDEGNIYFGYSIALPGADFGLMIALDSEGEKLWEFMIRDDEGDPKTGSQVFSSPAIEDGRLYFGSDNNRLYALEKENGTEAWNRTTTGNIFSSPAIGPEGTIYVGSGDKMLHAFKPNGTSAWRFRADGEIHSSPAVGPEGMIYFGSYDNNIYSLYPDGTERWRVKTEGRVFSSPALHSDGFMYIGSFDEKLYAIGIRFSISITEPEDGDKFEQGEEVVVNYTVTNFAEEDTQDIEFYVDGDLVGTEENITLGEGEDHEGGFNWTAEGPGEIDLEVTSEDDKEVVTVTVEEKDETKMIPNDVLPIVIAILLLSLLSFGKRKGKD